MDEKELILKDLSPRLRYGVKFYAPFYCINGDKTIIAIKDNKLILDDSSVLEVEYMKTYLRPMSSMTEEEYNDCKEINNLRWGSNYCHLSYKEIQGDCNLNLYSYVGSVGYEYGISLIGAARLFDWLNAHHFDYRNLIEKGLALEAPIDMYKIG